MRHCQLTVMCSYALESADCMDVMKVTNSCPWTCTVWGKLMRLPVLQLILWLVELIRPFPLSAVLGVKLDVETWMERFINATVRTSVRTIKAEAIVEIPCGLAYLNFTLYYTCSVSCRLLTLANQSKDSSWTDVWHWVMCLCLSLQCAKMTSVAVKETMRLALCLSY